MQSWHLGLDFIHTCGIQLPLAAAGLMGPAGPVGPTGPAGPTAPVAPGVPAAPVL